jgi:hypothetical protein
MKVPILLLSHVTLGLAGWWLACESRPGSTSEPTENPRTRSSRPRPPITPEIELIRLIESRLETDKAEKARLAAENNDRVRILKVLATLTLPPDPADAIIRLMSANDDDLIRAAALLVLWARSDPAAALPFASAVNGSIEWPMHDSALELVGESIAPEVVLAVAETRRHSPLLDGLARQLIASHTVDQLSMLMSGLNADVKSDLSFQLGYQWPAERLDDYGRLATAMNDPEMLRHAHWRLPTEEMADWLLRFADGHPDKEFARKIRESDLYLTLLSFQPAIPLERRLDAVLQDFSTGPLPSESELEEAMEFLANRDVSGFFDDDGPDFHHAFHHGEIEASELLARLTARFPEHAAAGLVPTLLYQELAPHDPDRAASLIAELPAAERARAIAGSRWSDCPLDTIGRVLDQFPDSDEKEIVSHRKALWDNHVGHGLREYGEDYLRWILSLPDPLDRKLALGAIADEIDDASSDVRAGELREITGDIPLRDPP